MERVVVPTFPDEDVRAFFFNCLARALAGEIPDKRWFACLGPRNCILCKLLKLAFGPFVRAMNAENLICKESTQDAAKAQSWMKPLEHTRVAYSNELRASGGARDKTLDGELIKTVLQRRRGRATHEPQGRDPGAAPSDHVPVCQ